jgi:hypothetical protein
VYGLAERLGKFAHEVMEMPIQEMNGWVAYFQYQNSVNKKHG